MKRGILLGFILALAVSAIAATTGLRPHTHKSTAQGGAIGMTRTLARGGGSPVFDCPNDTLENTALTYTLPGGTLGANGHLRIRSYWTFTNNANAKTTRVRACGAAGSIFGSLTHSSQTFNIDEVWIMNLGSESSNKGFAISINNSNQAESATFTVNTASDCNIVISCQKGLATDNFKLLGYQIEVLNP